MNEFVSAVGDWFVAGWTGPDDRDPLLDTHEFVIGPEPISEDLFDEGAGD